MQAICCAMCLEARRVFAAPLNPTCIMQSVPIRGILIEAFRDSRSNPAPHAAVIVNTYLFHNGTGLGHATE